MALVANCSHAGFINLPEFLPKHTDWLILSGNNLTSLSIQNTHHKALLQYLSKLDLRDNKIGKISSDVLDILMESNNLLYLDLSQNKLKTLPQSMKNLSSLQNFKIIDNKFKCSCDNIWMKDWLLNETNLIDDYENTYCQMTSGKWIPIVKMDKADMGCNPYNEEAFPIWNIAGGYSQVVL